jgi:hypothetical protein
MTRKLAIFAAVAMTLFLAGCTTSAQTTSPNKPTSTVLTTIPPLGGYRTTTTLPSQSTTPPPTLSSTMLQPPVTIQYEPGPAVPVPSVPCTDGELRATDFGRGPFTDMAESEDIIAISTSAPCELYGYPTVELGGSSHPLAIRVQHTGVVGHQATPRPVAVGTGTPASFLLQTAEGPIFPDCKETGLLSIGVPGSAPSVSVSLPAASFRSAWYVCGRVQVAPFEQGDTLDQYA